MSKVRLSFNDLILRLFLDKGLEESNRLLSKAIVRTDRGGVFKSLASKGGEFTFQFLRGSEYKLEISRCGASPKTWIVSPGAGTVEVDRITREDQKLVIWTKGDVVDHRAERKFFPDALTEVQLAAIMANRVKFQQGT